MCKNRLVSVNRRVSLIKGEIFHSFSIVSKRVWLVK